MVPKLFFPYSRISNQMWHYRKPANGCQDFPDLFKQELGCLKDFQLEIQFKPDSKPIFCKPRAVPFASQDDLTQAYDTGVDKGVWKPTQFNCYETPVVQSGRSSPGSRIWLREGRFYWRGGTLTMNACEARGGYEKRGGGGGGGCCPF